MVSGDGSCPSPPKRVLYSTNPAYTTTLHELTEAEEPPGLTNDFIFPPRIADSLVAYVLLPTREFGSRNNLPIRENLPSRVCFSCSYQSSLPPV